MNNLFINLSTYKPTEYLTPIENYTTETFVYILKYSLNNKTNLFLEFLRLLEINKSFLRETDWEIKTQQPFMTTDKTIAYPDIAIELPDKLLILIEVKVGSKINMYETENEIINQIQKYNRIISHIPFKIFLLTKYIIDLDCSNIYWREVFILLKKYKSENEIEMFLIANFLNYLKEKGMDVPKVSYELMRGMESLNNLCKQLEIVLEKYTIAKSFGYEWLGYYIKNPENNTILAWVGTMYDGERLRMTVCRRPNYFILSFHIIFND